MTVLLQGGEIPHLVHIYMHSLSRAECRSVGVVVTNLSKVLKGQHMQRLHAPAQRVFVRVEYPCMHLHPRAACSVLVRSHALMNPIADEDEDVCAQARTGVP